jgi:mono/diheme cytochrome c family protein
VKRLIHHHILAVFILFASCSDNSSKKEAKPLDTPTISEEKSPTGEPAETAPHPGKAVYDKYCLACHLADGTGITGMFPPLTPNEYVNNKEKMIDVVLNGMSGKIEIDGETYNNFMLPHSHLTDEELANVISYVRANFGNNLEPVTKDEINAAR